MSPEVLIGYLLVVSIVIQGCMQGVSESVAWVSLWYLVGCLGVVSTVSMGVSLSFL